MHTERTTPPKPGREPDAPDRDWPGYYDAVEGRDPRDTLLRALDAFEREPLALEPGASETRASESGSPLALDLGCGEGRDTLELLRRGWRVLAIDPCRDGLDRLLARVEPGRRGRLEIVESDLESAALPSATLVNASFTVPFLDPDRFDETWARIAGAVAAGGRFAGQFFGDRDQWAPIPGRIHHTRAQVEALLAGFEPEFIDEVERDGKDAFGNPKHWHVFHVVARRSRDPR